ncbi:putative PEP-CTERM system TPR-repeat lipoprotein [Variovorax sp. SRS16]|uniref:tetratricopeptide repeat protein n=1 Tax=Variovorax sp. SRS16 TaxID=282217 RepID=UPI0013194B5A|nr:hypothetical protein [Variovorax sp. SRS16]VTU13727.1 putative PEP-CTERM system TPR-repeat lipoprotein [Variovorax sp. SRS16]
MKFKSLIGLLTRRSTGSQNLWNQAEAAESSNDERLAAEIYHRIERTKPRNESDFLRAALASERRGEWDRAIDRLEQGLRVYPQSAAILGAYVQRCLAQQRSDKGVAFLSAMHGSTDKARDEFIAACSTPETQIDLIRILLQDATRGWPTQSLSTVVGRMERLEGLWSLGDEFLQGNRREAANEIYRLLASRPVETASEFMFAALSESRLQNVDRALEIFEAGLRRYPEDQSLLQNFGRICSGSGRVDQLATWVSSNAANSRQAHEALFLKFADPHIQVNLIAHLLNGESRALAMNRIEIARTEFRSSLALWELADVMLQNQLREEADSIYRNLSSRVAETPDDFFFAALANERQGDKYAAIACLEAGLERVPQSDRLLEQLARICVEIGQVERMGRFIGVDGQDREYVVTLLFERFQTPAIQVSLIDYCLKHGLLGLADQKLELVKANSTDAKTLWGVAELFSRLARRNDAMEIYKRLAQRDPNTPDDCYYSALGLLRLEKPEQCLDVLEAGQSKFGCLNDLLTLYLQICARSLNYERYARFLQKLRSGMSIAPLSALDFYKAASRMAPVDFIVNLKDLEAELDPQTFGVLRRELTAHLREKPLPIEVARVVAFFCKYLDTNPDIDAELFAAIDAPAAGYDDAERRALKILHDLTLPMIPHYSADPEEVVRSFISAAQSITSDPKVLADPISDVTANWTPWQLIFCHAVPRLYGEAMAAFESMAFSTWPRLDHVAPHVNMPATTGGGAKRKLRVGFNVHDSMPMMSGLLTQLDDDLFETIYLRPGKQGQTPASKKWCERADAVVEYSDIDMYAAIETISNERLDIIISGPAVAAAFYPMMARLAPLQMVLLEPNWTDGLKNSDYYISWGLAEPKNPSTFYASSVAYFQHPPYWIERPAEQQSVPISRAERTEVRQRLLKCGAEARVYLCANTPPKVHPEMDKIFVDLLERDSEGILVFLRAEYKNLRIRLQEKLGPLFARVVFVPALPKDDAHRLLRAVDCCLDSYPLCGMSSSFDGAMLGVPIVTLPSGIPFGEWTSAIYEYIGVEGLTARSREEYVSIAVKIAKDPAWRQQLSSEIREKSLRFVESTDASAEFQDFLLRAWERKVSGASAANWIDGRWQ